MITENEKLEQIQELPVIALRGLVVFPQTMIHFDVGRKKSLQALHEAMDHYDQTVFLVTQTDVEEDDPTEDGLYAVGVIAQIRQVLKLPGDSLRILVEGMCRARLIDVVQSDPFYKATVEELPFFRMREEYREEAMLRQCRTYFENYIELAHKPSPDVMFRVAKADNAGLLADEIASGLPFPVEDKQHLLGTVSVERRVERLLSILEKETEILQLEKEIHDKVQGQMDQNQRDYYLHEQMKAIAEELGEEDPLEEAETYRRKVRALTLSDEVRAKFLEECDKLAKMPSGSHEATVVRGYLDLCLSLPWATFTEDTYDLINARQILDRDHYGLDKVKERMVELLAVRCLNPDIKGQIICLAGPPGVGKTSVAKAIAEAMGRKYVRVSLGGVKDESDIRGHRKTYIGAMPGRIITALKNAGSSNPLLLLDEIDKMSNDFRGDPASAMLEVLDPEQNSTFEDHYVEVPYDLSKVLFMTTANDLDAIPAPLKDRMEIITLPSYTAEEKFHIAKQHLWKKQLKQHGLTAKQVRITDKALKTVIANYTKEAGVRKLERELAKILRKTAATIVRGECDTVSVRNVEPYLGPRRYKTDTKRISEEVGVVNGLAWTSVGGELLPIEVAVLDGTGKIELTGSLGDVMKESARIAVSYVRSRAAQWGIPTDFYKNKDIHIHAPEGAVPKDGPSAGVTMTTALVSALTGIPVKQTVAMTGEVSLRGKVLPIGGLREKAMAAYLNGMTTVLIPADNEADLAEVDAVVKEHLRFVTVRQVDAVLQEALCADPFRPTVTKEALSLPSINAPLPRNNENKKPTVRQ